MQTLLALQAIAASAVADGSPDMAPGAIFDADDAMAAKLIEAGDAKPYVAVPEGKKVKVRLLNDCQHGAANDVVTLSADDAQAAQNGGYGDSDPGAVAYAAELRQNWSPARVAEFERKQHEGR